MEGETLLTQAAPCLCDDRAQGDAAMGRGARRSGSVQRTFLTIYLSPKEDMPGSESQQVEVGASESSRLQLPLWTCNSGGNLGRSGEGRKQDGLDYRLVSGGLP